MEEKELAEGHYEALDEIATWRAWYLKNKFTNSNYALLPDDYKHRLTMYFMAGYTEKFDTPDLAWDACVCSLLSYLAEEKGDHGKS